MAEIVGGLFGVTPEALMAQREQALAQQAQQFAQLSPMQSAQAGFYTAGNRLAGAAGGLLGAQDPEMMRIQQRQQLLQGIDISDPKALRERASAAMQNNDYAAAQQLASRAMDIEAKMASTAKDTAAANRERVQSTPADILKAQRAAAIKAALPAYKEAGDMATYTLLEDELNALLPADKTPSFGAEAERYSRQYFNKPYSALTSEEMAKVNAKVEETSKNKAPQIILPGQPVEPKDWLKFREFADKTPVMTKTSALLSELPNALETIRMSTTNDIAAAALPKALASVAGEGKVTSNADIARYARTGGLDDRLIQGATNFITGKATQTKKAEAEKYASAVYRGALLERKKFIQSEAKQLGYDQSPNYAQSIADIDAELAKFKKPSEMKPVDSVVRVQPTGNPLIDKYLNVQTP